MKISFSILFIVLTCFVSAQTRKKIILKTDDKTTLHNSSFWLDVLVKSTDTSFFYALHSQKKDIIEVLKEGKYTLTFNSVFGHKITQELIVGKKKKYTIKVKGLNAFYGKIPTINTLSDKLKANDTLYILRTTSGATISYEKMGITKLSDGRYTAMLFKGNTDEVFMDYTVNEATYAVVKANELLLKDPQQNLCAPDIYTFCLRKEYYSISDVSCKINALDRMKARLFLVEGK